MSKAPKKLARAALVAALRERVILRTEQGGRLVGRCCDLCGDRWRGRAERHRPTCVLAGEAVSS